MAADSRNDPPSAKALAPRPGVWHWILLPVRMVAYLVVVILLLATGVWLANPVATADTSSVSVLADDGGDRPLRIFAMGDSFISGEGADTFFEGTDRPGTNTCHRAPTAYPVLVAERLRGTLAPELGFTGVELTFVACSGAETVNVGSAFSDPDTIPEPQFEGQDGQRLQVDYLRAVPQPDVILIGLGGNDARFRDVVVTCAGRANGCEEMAQPWIDRLDPGGLTDPNAADGDSYVLQSLVDVYSEVRSIAPNALIFATTYPDPLSAPSCAHTGLDTAETRFISEYFLSRLNSEVLLAAGTAGISAIDLSDAFEGQGLCARGDDDGPAMNGFTFQRTASLPPLSNLSSIASTMQGSMHPTAAGHDLFADVVAHALEFEIAYLARDVDENGTSVPSDGPPPDGPPSEPPSLPPPGPPPGGDLPSEGGPLKWPDSLPPIIPPVTPDGKWFMRDNPCSVEGDVYAIEPRVDEERSVVGAAPGSMVCVAEFAQEFRVSTVEADGSFVIEPSDRPTVAGLGGRRDVIYLRADGEWVLLAEVAPPGAPVAQLSEAEAWLGSAPQAIWILFGAAIILVALLVFVDSRVMRRGRVRRARAV